jgi:hypothetical protein
VDYPEKCNGAPDSDPLYVSKHDGIQNFTTSWNTRDWSRQVPVGELANDLRTGDVPRFSYVVPDECHDMHGDPPYCLDSGNIGDPQNQHLVSVGDAYPGPRLLTTTTRWSWTGPVVPGASTQLLTPAAPATSSAASPTSMDSCGRPESMTMAAARCH